MAQVCVNYSTPHRTSVIARSHGTKDLGPNNRSYAISTDHQRSLVQHYNHGLSFTTQNPQGRDIFASEKDISTSNS